MPRRKIPGQVVLIFVLPAPIVMVAMEFVAPGLHIRAALDSQAPFLTPTQRLESFFDRALRPDLPVNPFR